MIRGMIKVKVRDGAWIFCERHKGYFFSSVYAKTGRKPVQCNICKRLDYEKVKL